MYREKQLNYETFYFKTNQANCTAYIIPNVKTKIIGIIFLVFIHKIQKHFINPCSSNSDDSFV